MIAERDAAGSSPGQRHALKPTVDLEYGSLWTVVDLVEPAGVIRPPDNQITGAVMFGDHRAVVPGFHLRCRAGTPSSILKALGGRFLATKSSNECRDLNSASGGPSP